jgi:hypothetical protein
MERDAVEADDLLAVQAVGDESFFEVFDRKHVEKTAVLSVRFYVLSKTLAG